MREIEREKELLREIEKLRQKNKIMALRVNRLERKTNKINSELKSMRVQNDPVNVRQKYFKGKVAILENET